MAWQGEPTNELLLHFVDYAGIRATSNYWIAPGQVNPAGGAAAAIAGGAQGISDDALYLVEILRRAAQDAAVTPTDGPYPRAADKVKLVFTASDGSEVKMEVPGPNETILGTGHVYVDPADAALVAFVNYVKTNCKSAEGATITGLKRGYRMRPPRRKHQ